MIGYGAFAELSQSRDSDVRGQAAHMAALAYLQHTGAADEHAALYAALVGFLDDTSIKVRAALAYGLLHSSDAPRPVSLALLQDSAVISRAVLQYSPVLVDADLVPMVSQGDEHVMLAISQRAKVSARLAATLIARGDLGVTLRLVKRKDVAIPSDVLQSLSHHAEDDAELRGALLSREDLPATARLALVHQVTKALRANRLVKGALTGDRLDRLMRDGTDTAVAAIGEAQPEPGRVDFVESLVSGEKLNTRVLLHAMVTGRALFFASCIARLANVGDRKVFTLLDSGNSASLKAMFLRCGMSVATSNLLVRLVMLARTADLADDVGARHYVITALTEELISEYRGEIPLELEEAFTYLNSQNISLAKRAARGVMAIFANGSQAVLAVAQDRPVAQLPAA